MRIERAVGAGQQGQMLTAVVTSSLLARAILLGLAITPTAMMGDGLDAALDPQREQVRRVG